MSRYRQPSRLVSGRRLVTAFCLAVIVVALDTFVLQIVGIESVTALAVQTTIHTIGIYGGLSLTAFLTSESTASAG